MTIGKQNLSELRISWWSFVLCRRGRWIETKRLSVSCQSGEDWIKIGRQKKVRRGNFSPRKSRCQRWLSVPRNWCLEGELKDKMVRGGAQTLENRSLGAATSGLNCPLCHHHHHPPSPPYSSCPSIFMFYIYVYYAFMFFIDFLCFSARISWFTLDVGSTSVLAIISP